MPERQITAAPADVDTVPALGSELRAPRVAAGPSQRDLATKINYSHVTIHKAERSTRPPSWPVVETVARTCVPPARTSTGGTAYGRQPVHNHRSSRGQQHHRHVHAQER
ncbi:transcriptional regulator [Kibdelosporangium aridum]|uniref:Transcriptional regulator n=1 Tax=Kibdelosporangium aridum TaxID=2030 RepID=A0A428ZCI0_KIBAR|nr:transcriptional regulator [Kibdelosporangium aridum]